MKKLLTLVFSLVLLALITVPVLATTTNLIYTPTTTGLTNISGIDNDSAPGFPTGSFIPANTSIKSEMYISPTDLFGRDIKLGEIKSINYWTRTGVLHNVDPRDWYLNIYTKKYTDQTAGWYGARIGAEPYFSENINENANDWNNWNTDSSNNQLRFFESTYGYFGSYTDPHWDSFVSGSSLIGPNRPTSIPYENQDVLYFSLGTGSGWANGFTGKLDGLKIELKDGSIATVNFELNLPKCTKTGFIRDGIDLTAAIINPTALPETVDATGCNIGVYYGPGKEGSIDGVEIFGANYYGVVVHQAYVDVVDSNIHNIGEIPFNGAQHGVGIYYANVIGKTNGDCTSEGEGTGGSIRQSTVSAYQKGGIVVSCPHTYVEVTDNEITGNTPVDYIAQNGIQFGYGAAGEASRNMITGNYYNGTNWTSTGLLLFDVYAKDIKRFNNKFKDNQTNFNMTTVQACPHMYGGVYAGWGLCDF